MPVAEAHFGDSAEAASGDSIQEPGSPFLYGILITVVLTYLQKLLAHVGQQKLFGERMGSSVTIRAMVDINSPSLKAIRYILEQPGLSFPKVGCNGCNARPSSKIGRYGPVSSRGPFVHSLTPPSQNAHVAPSRTHAGVYPLRRPRLAHFRPVRHPQAQRLADIDRPDARHLTHGTHGHRGRVTVEAVAWWVMVFRCDDAACLLFGDSGEVVASPKSAACL